MEEHLSIPMNSDIFLWVFMKPVFKTNAADKLYVQPLCSQFLIYHLGRLFLNSSIFLVTRFMSRIVGLAPRKKLSIDIFISASQGLDTM